MVTTPETPRQMTEIDQALRTLLEDMDNAKRLSKFYDIFLNTTFCVPSFNRQELDGEPAIEDGQVLPLIIESEGNEYLMLFDTEERMKNWAGADVEWVEVPGFVIAATTMPPLHLALNAGTEYSKQFLPDEIAWLREVVERCNEAEQAKEQPNP